MNLMLPIDWVVLNNAPTGSSSNVTGMSWKKISGPGSYNVSYSNSKYTGIFDLVEGHHQFELTANYVNGSVSKDTVHVNLYDVSMIPQNAKEIIIENLSWSFPWYATLQIADFYDNIPRESLFRIFVRRDGSTNWEDVPGWAMSGPQNNLYDYFIERRLPDGAGMYTNGSLYISYYGTDTFDTPDIKIVYW
ncbi:PKD domain-containing protein [Flavobacteriaceae bacterium LMO-SS05]